MSKPLKGFITYSHEDTEAKDKLRKHLAVMEQQNKLVTWHDGEITAGDEWYEDIASNLTESDILLYLVSATSLASKNCNKELAEALSANIRVIPIILEHCDWLNHQLSDFQALPDQGKPITKWEDPSEGWQNVVYGIREAAEEMQVQVKPSPRITQEEIEVLANWALQHGNFLMMLGQIDRAIEAYSRTIELKPDDAAAYNNRGTAYVEKDEYNSAIKDFNEAIQLKFDDALAHNNRGNVYNDIGDFDRAIEDYNTAIQLKRDYADAYNNRGNAYRNKGDFDRAIENYNTAMKFKPDFAKAHNNRGVAYSGKDNYDLAIADFDRATELDPDYANAFFNRGIAYNKQGEVDRAIDDFTKAIELKPDFTEAHYYLGIAYSEKK